LIKSIQRRVIDERVALPRIEDVEWSGVNVRLGEAIECPQQRIGEDEEQLEAENPQYECITML